MVAKAETNNVITERLYRKDVYPEIRVALRPYIGEANFMTDSLPESVKFSVAVYKFSGRDPERPKEFAYDFAGVLTE